MLSAVIIAKNEEQNIKKCLERLSWCDEIVVIDDYSKDKTAAIARNSGARVYRRSLNRDFAAQRNFGLTKVKGEWVLFVDADEQVSRELAEEIKQELKNPRADAYLIKRIGIFDEWLVRLGKRDAGRWSRAVHEVWKINGRVMKLGSPLLHSPTDSLSGFIKKLNFYSTLHAESHEIEGKKTNFAKIVFMPLFKFFYSFVVKRGYRDGTRGFVYATLMSFHSFLAWSKQWTT